ncbi:MAG: FHA domain-containing protein, partial [Cyanobacteria bacterium J06636_16]
VLYSAVVSRHHVELRQTPSGWEIVNLGTNGTYLEGKRISQVAAQDGTVIRLARSGPNVQISIGSGSSETVKALMRLRAEAAAAQQAKEKNTTAKELETEKQTHPVAETLTPSRLDEEKPNSKNWTYMEEEE